MIDVDSDDEWSDYEQNNESSFLYRSEQGGISQKRQARQLNQEVGELFQSKWLVFKAGRISQCAQQWAEITSDIHILKAVRGFHIDFMSEEGEYIEPSQNTPQQQLRYSREEKQFLRVELQELLQKEVISEVDHIAGEYISNVFLREKKDKGKFRMILNLKKLNELVQKQHFKMDTLLSAITMVKKDCWFLSLDFTDAYYSVRVAPESRKYLRFKFEEKL